MSSAICFNLDQSKILLSADNPFPNKLWFLRVWGTSLLKILWVKEKLLIISNFSFFHSLFYPLGELSAILIKFKIVGAHSFSLEGCKICCLGKD